MPDSKKPTLLLIDGHSLAFRAFYALPVDSFVTRDGQHTNAIHGFLSMLNLLLQNERPTHLAVAFDKSRVSFRTAEYPEYKGTRGETPPEFKGQIPLLQEALAAMNIPTLEVDNYEADDIIATLATKGAADGFQVLVTSGDRDTIQLVNDDIILLYPNARGVSELKRYDRDAVVEKYGIEPEQYPEIAALVGETSDNLIGIEKVGEKTAVKWIQQYGSLDNLLAHADEITGVVGGYLRDQQDRAIRNRKLNRLVTDMELEYAPADLARKPMNVEAVTELFGRLQFKALLERLLKIEGVTDEAKLTSGGATASELPPVQTPAGVDLEAWLDKHSDGGTAPLGVRVALLNGTVDGVGIAGESDSAWVPWGDAVLEAWLAGSSPKHVYDAKRQGKALAAAGVELGGVDLDPALQAWLLRPSQKSETLASLVYYYLGENLPQPDPNQLVPETEALSPASEAWFVRRLAVELAGRLDPGSLRVLHDIEVPLGPVLARMEVQGITVSATVLSGLNERLGTQVADIAARAYAEIGREVNLGSPKQLQEVLFDQLGMPKTRSNKTGFSTDAQSLQDLQDLHPHPFLELLLQHRDATKIKQIVETLQKGLGPDGRVHTNYEQTGSATGRLASNDPNLQNIPIKTEVGREVRTAFVPGEGFDTLLTADYSQIEMRIMAHLSEDAGLIEAFNSGEDLHRFVGARVFGVDPADVTPTMRTKVKAMSYGLAYGLSPFGLSKQLRIDVSEAKELIADYLARFGGVRDYLRGVVEQARIDGYTTTLFGRRRPFGDLTSTNRTLRENAERQALNSPIQGSAADVIKIAMLGIDADIRERGLASRMLLQVHDELVLEVVAAEVDEVTAIVTDRMAHAADLSVPLDVQVGSGPNWDAAAH
ncbi:DNA polymerase I [Pseudolysinimonas yzui]|uniref:DNA polymerase I n=1 Tax=Pseudolysinimonas yzui TaxID=2708254 RepID=A0A8J3GNX5_9MICO|nr:DNA polymerase I [Pseudolysinimonas yzui]GHF09103.1 DNA polymerase (POL I) [Pseudolysinimonas yzui]